MNAPLNSIAHETISLKAATKPSREIARRDTAKVFTTGRSQAVRLPKAYRFNTTEVTIERRGDEVVLRSMQEQGTWGEQVMAALNAFDPEFKIERTAAWTQSERESLKF